MPPDHDLPDLEFGTNADRPAADEELPARPEREYLLLRRLRRPLGFLVVAALVVLGVVKLLTLGGSGTPSATRSSGASGSPGPSGVSSRVPVPAVPTPTLSATYIIRSGAPGSFVLRSNVIAAPSGADGTVGIDPAPGTSWTLDPGSGELTTDGADSTPCPDTDTCSTAYDLPDPVLRALRAAYPGAVVTRARTVSIVGTTSSTLLSRSIVATADGRTIHVRVGSQGIGPDDSGNHVQGPDRLVYADSSASGYEIDTLVIEPADRPASDAAALRLAQNPALTVPS